MNVIMIPGDNKQTPCYTGAHCYGRGLDMPICTTVIKEFIHDISMSHQANESNMVDHCYATGRLVVWAAGQRDVVIPVAPFTNMV